MPLLRKERHAVCYVLAGVLLCLSISAAAPCNDASNSPVVSGCGSTGTRNMDTGQCCATIFYGPLSASDADAPCALLFPTITGPASGSCFPLGTTALSYYVEDSAGNFDFCFWSYTVVDNQNPVISCPANINAFPDPGQCSSVQTFAFTASDNCGVSVTSNFPSGYAFPTGTTVVSATATDPSGRTATCSFTVTVTDNQPPSLLCPSPSDHVWSAALSFTLTPSTAVCLSFGAFADNTNPAPGSYSFITISSDTGDLPITCSEQAAVDTLANAFRFRTPIQVTCNGVVWGVGNNCFPACGPDVILYAGMPEPINPCNCIGVGWIVRPMISFAHWGSAGGYHCNPPSQTLTVTFGSRTKLRTSPGQCQTASTRFNVGITDDCGILSSSTVPTSPAVFAKSASPVTITASALDNSGNPGSCSAVMTISDMEKPVPACPTSSYVFTALMLDSVPTAKICRDWTAYAAGVDNTPNAYTSITISSTLGTPITCSDQTAVNTLAAAFKTHTPVQVTCGGVPWGVGSNCVLNTGYCVPNGQDTILYAGTTTPCACVNAWVYRPQIATPDWGHGGGGPSCSHIPQTITIKFAKAVKLNTLAGVCYANQITPVTGSDNCPGTVTTINPSGTQFNKGTTIVTMTSTDSSSNIGTCTFDVIVTDNQNPTISCPSNFNINTGVGLCTAVQSFTFTVNDNCAGVTTSSVPPSGATFNKGTTTVTGTATDAVSRTATCTFTVTVQDNENPVAICPSNAVVNTDFGVCTATRTYTIGATDNCAGVTFTSSHSVNAFPFPRGVTNILVTATDAVSNQGTCAFSVTVNDNQNPTIACPANINVGAQLNSCQQTVTFTINFSDNCGATLVTSHASGAAFPVGVTTVTATATDATGNSATCSFTITVVDPVPPVIICPSKVAAQTDNGRCDAIVGYVASATDNCSLKGVTYSPLSGTIFNIGTTQVTATATDGGGLQSSCTFPVVVSDKEAPNVNCPIDKVLNADAGLCTTVTSYNPTATDNCQLSATPPTLNPSSPSTFSVGRTTVTYIATDTSGLFTVCDFTVTVLDTQPPTITCPGNIVVSSDPSVCSKTVTFGQGTVNDNCGISSVTSVPASGYEFPAGVTTVTNTVIDRSGLSASCTFTVTVQDATGRCNCGNGRIDPGEQCEVNILNGATCASKGYPDGGDLDCVNCHYEYSRCAQCNDGRVDGSEECDGTNLNAQTCQSLGQGFTSGQLRCSNQCRFVTTGCGKCGDGAIQSPEEECDGSNLNQKTCQTVTGVTGGGTLLCGSNCRFDISQCIVPKVTKPTGSTVIEHLTLGISVSATGFVNDRKVTVTLTDGTNIKSYPGLSLTLPAGSINAMFQAPAPLAPSNKWKVSVKGETTLYVASSALFTVKAF